MALFKILNIGMLITLMALPFFIKNISISPMTWIFVDPLSNGIMMPQLLDTLVNLPFCGCFS
jgi:hypothetical protein